VSFSHQHAYTGIIQRHTTLRFTATASVGSWVGCNSVSNLICAFLPPSTHPCMMKHQTASQSSSQDRDPSKSPLELQMRPSERGSMHGHLSVTTLAQLWWASMLNSATTPTFAFTSGCTSITLLVQRHVTPAVYSRRIRAKPQAVRSCYVATCWIGPWMRPRLVGVVVELG
jgi:hypothetical protein